MRGKKKKKKKKPSKKKTTKLTKHKRPGQPSKYDPKFCKMIVKHCEEGLSFESFAYKAKVHVDTIYEWCKRHPEFSEAKKRAYAASLYFWELRGIKGMQGKIPWFSASTWIFTVKCRFNYKESDKNQPGIEDPIDGFSTKKPQDYYG